MCEDKSISNLIRIYFTVKPEEDEIAKSLGAILCKDMNTWYVTTDMFNNRFRTDKTLKNMNKQFDVIEYKVYGCMNNDYRYVLQFLRDCDIIEQERNQLLSHIMRMTKTEWNTYNKFGRNCIFRDLVKYNISDSDVPLFMVKLYKKYKTEY